MGRAIGRSLRGLSAAGGSGAPPGVIAGLATAVPQPALAECRQ
jgi:hypothetical protein